MLWAVLQALTGAALDVPARTLHLGPRTGGEIARLRCPFFFPGVWAMLDYEPDKGHVSVEVLRHFGVPHTIDTVICHAPNGTQPQRTRSSRRCWSRARSLEVDFDRGKKVK